MAMNLDTVIHSIQTPQPATLLQQLAEAIDSSADDYNALADAYEQQQERLINAELVIALKQSEISELKKQLEQLPELQAQLDVFREKSKKTDELLAQVQSLQEGNKLLIRSRQELTEELKKTKTAFEVAYDKSVKSVLKIKELQTELSSIKQHGDPKKLIAANKTLRDRNIELTKQNETLNKESARAIKEMEKMMEKAAPSLVEPSYSKNGENIYLHPQPLKVQRDGKIMTLIALTWWNTAGIGRVVTWDTEKDVAHFASVGHKTVDAKLKPSQEALDWICAWFRKNIQTVGSNQTFKTQFQIKAGKK